MLRCKNYHIYSGRRCVICIAAQTKLRRARKAALKRRYDAQNRERQAEKDRQIREATLEQQRQHVKEVRQARIERMRLYHENRKKVGTEK